MKKTILALALAAGLISFAGNTKADIITANLNETSTGVYDRIGFGFKDGSITSDYNYGIFGTWVPGEYDPFFPPDSIPASGRIGLMNGQSAGNGYFNGSNKTLGYGTLIDGSLRYQTNAPNYVGVDISSGQYWAVKFNQGNGNYNYGWVQVDVNDSVMTFGLAAVNTTLNESIRAGAVPEPSTYALFGIGAVGMLMVLRRKKTA